jgi:uncharacterized membrane protein
MNLDNVLLALHVMGAMMWIGGLFATVAFLEVTIAEPDAGAKARLLKATRAAAIVPDVGLTIAIVFGAHWFMKFKLYEAHFMWAKLGAVAVLITIHVILRGKVGKLKRGEVVQAPPPPLKPVISLTALAVLIFVLTKWPG